jgi:hypothetical protein
VVGRGGKLLVVLLLALAVPATAQTFGFSLRSASPSACLSIGGSVYRIASGERADYTVRIDPATISPDIRIQLAETPDEADFVLVDDGDDAPACRSRASGIRNVKIDAAASTPDLTIGFAAPSAQPDYRIFVRSRWVAPEAVAALFAASRVAARLVTSHAAIR